MKKIEVTHCQFCGNMTNYDPSGLGVCSVCLEKVLEHVFRAYNSRLTRRSTIRRNSFEAWGNDKCIARLGDTIDALKNGTASKRLINYWLRH